MDLRSQEKDISVPNSIAYNSSQFNQNQHPLLNQQQHIRKDDASPDPDPAPVATAAVVVTASNSRTTPPTNSSSVPDNSSSIRYKECLKNHAASMGGHVVDGCGEFMPSGEDGTIEAFRCAACNCHRNFHRREIDGEPHAATSHYYTYNSTRNNVNPTHRSSVFHSHPPPSLPIIHQSRQNQHQNYSSRGPPAPVMMAFGGNGGAPAESSSEDLNMFQTNLGAQALGQTTFSVSKKRFRTKFTQEQKDKMNEFGKKLGWRIQKKDEEEVQQFCDEVGVKRQVFKVWMHNNKQAMKKRES